jgi:dihydrofolate reductase
MIVSAIAAIDRSGVIGNGMKMPWHLPQDLKRFRKNTLGKPVIMGRRTLESLQAPLEKRLNIVLTHNRSFVAERVRVAQSIEEALEIARQCSSQASSGEVMIIGGGVVFEQTAHLWDRLLLTVVDGSFRGDTYFPLNKTSESRWRLITREYHPPTLKNTHPHWFLDLERRKVDDPDFDDFDLLEWLKHPSTPVT